MYSLADYDYELPPGLIAQQPAAPRDCSRLLMLDRKSGRLSHHTFNAIGTLIDQADVLVVNNTKVVPARLFGKKETGGKVEVLILDFAQRRQSDPNPGAVVCDCLIKASKRPKPGNGLCFEGGLKGEILHIEEDIVTIRFDSNNGFEQALHQIGKTPLPPYIKRTRHNRLSDDHTAYQTVYASESGAVAAPTAGFHFTQALLAQLRAQGVKIIEITLHVGYGTFLPVRVSDIRAHRMHTEWFSISPQAEHSINFYKENGHRIVAVGTTCARTLEYAAQSNGRVKAGQGLCDLFIYPGYSFQVIDALITNFHLPKSTLLMLVSAFAGREKILSAYQEAVYQKYRFFSYGDAMLIV